MKTVIFQFEKMSSSAFLLKFIVLLFLSSIQPLMANPVADSASHADPKRVTQNSYGPIRANDTLWSIAKLLSKPNQSITQVIDQLKTTNPASIKANNTVIIGKYIHRIPLSEKTTTLSAKKSANKITTTQTTVSKNNFNKPTSNTLALITKTIYYHSTADTYLNTKIWDIPPLEFNSSKLENNHVQQASSFQATVSNNNYFIISLGIVIISLLLFFITTKIKQQINHQQLADAETTKINQLKRELIKNRLLKTLASNPAVENLIQS